MCRYVFMVYMAELQHLPSNALRQFYVKLNGKLWNTKTLGLKYLAITHGRDCIVAMLFLPHQLSQACELFWLIYFSLKTGTALFTGTGTVFIVAVIGII